jgi:uncharacterized membrane protein
MGLICLAWLLWMLRLTLHKWYGLGFGAFDIGIFDQGLWLLANGEEPFVTLRGLHLFADHASYLIYLLVPLYWVWEDARLLLLLAVLAPVVAGWLSFRISRVEGLTPAQSVLVGATVLVMPAMLWTPWDAFHPETLAVALIPASYLAARRGRFWWAIALAAVVLLAKEDAGLVIAPYALYMWWRWKEARPQAYVLAATAVGITMLSLLVVLPGYSPTGELIYTGRYVWDPDRLLTMSRAAYLPAMLIPAGLALMAPRFLLIGLPITLANLASLHGYQHDIRWHYTAYLLGVLAVAVPLGSSATAAKVRRFGGLPAASLAAALVIAIAFTVVAGPDLVTWHGEWNGLSADERGEVRDLLAAVPADAAVSATWSLAPHLAHRTDVYMIPNPWVPLYWGYRETVPDPPDPMTIEYFAIDTRTARLDLERVLAMIAGEDWEVVVDGTFRLLRRG